MVAESDAPLLPMLFPAHSELGSTPNAAPPTMLRNAEPAVGANVKLIGVRLVREDDEAWFV